MKRLTYFECGKWRLKIGDTEYSGEAVDHLAAYEETGLEPEKIEQLKGEVFGLKVDKQELEQYRAIGPIDRRLVHPQADREKRIIVIPKDNDELLEKLKDLFFSDWAALEGMKNG